MLATAAGPRHPASLALTGNSCRVNGRNLRKSRTLPARLARAAIAAELAGGGALERDRF